MKIRNQQGSFHHDMEHSLPIDTATLSGKVVAVLVSFFKPPATKFLSKLNTSEVL